VSSAKYKMFPVLFSKILNFRCGYRTEKEAVSALFIFLILEGDHSVLYVRRENVDVSMWLGIKPIDDPNCNKY